MDKPVCISFPDFKRRGLPLSAGVPVDIRIYPNKECGGLETAERIRDLFATVSFGYVAFQGETVPSSVAVLVFGSRVTDDMGLASVLNTCHARAPMMLIDGQEDKAYFFLYPEKGDTSDSLLRLLLGICKEMDSQPTNILLFSGISLKQGNFEYSGEVYKY